MVSTKHQVASAPRNKQIPTSPPHHHPTAPDHLYFWPFRSTFLPKLVDLLPPQWNMAAPWSQCTGGPLHFRAHAACSTATMFRTELQREDEQKWVWFIPKEEAEYSTSAQPAGSDERRPDKQKLDRASPKNVAASNTGSNESHPVLPRGSVLLQHCGTKRAAVQTNRLGRARGSRPPRDVGGHPDVSPNRVAPVVLHPTEILDGTPQTDCSAAFSELWTRFVTRAGSCRCALRQLSLSNYGTESRLSLRPQPEL